MKKRKSFSINRITFGNTNVNELSNFLGKLLYTDESGYGISNLEIVDKLISALLIKRNSTYIQEYNSLTQVFEKKSIFLYSRIFFHIDLEYNLLYTNGPASNLLQVKMVLRNLLNIDFQITGLDLPPFKIYQSLKNKKIKFQLSELSIDRFNFKEGAVGKYLAVISDTNIGVELIKLYRNDISKIVFTFNNYRLLYYNNNIISIIGKAYDIEENLQNFKTIIS
jgi:hypothetical protein